MATDAQGNVFATGTFAGTVTFGATTLTSAGYNDAFVAKWERASGNWSWAQRGGGSSDDFGYGIAVSGSNVYVTGSFTNTTSNDRDVTFGGISPATSATQVNGASASATYDLFVAKYTDNGPTGTLNWTQVGGGTGGDFGVGIAVSGSSVYVTGNIENSSANANTVLFGGSGATAGTVPVNGATTTASVDVLLAKYTDNGSSATLGWTQVGGGTYFDYGYGVAVSGSNVYVAGVLCNSTNNSFGALFGGNGTTAGTATVRGATTSVARDLLLVKYTDNGLSATLGWTQVAGGTGSDNAHAVAVSGNSVYITGYLSNNTLNANAVVFGGNGTTAGTRPQHGASPTVSADVIVAKYTDNGATGSYLWSQVGGGSANDFGQSIAVSGNRVYVAGFIDNSLTNANAAVFGGSSTIAGTVPVSGTSNLSSLDLLLARYTDNGASSTYNWAQVGGGSSTDLGYGLALSGQHVYTGGYVTPSSPITFGTSTVPASSTFTLYQAVLARLTDADLTPLATTGAEAVVGMTIYPNPATHTVNLSGAIAGASVRVYDALSRLVLTVRANNAGMATFVLPAHLSSGLYLVRSETRPMLRLVVE